VLSVGNAAVSVEDDGNEKQSCRGGGGDLDERRRFLRRGALLVTVVRGALRAERTMASTEAQMSGVTGSVGIREAAKLAALRLETSASAFAVAEPTGAPVLTLDLEWGMCARWNAMRRTWSSL
jgi:hypothetical protein